MAASLNVYAIVIEAPNCRYLVVPFVQEPNLIISKTWKQASPYRTELGGMGYRVVLVWYRYMVRGEFTDTVC